MFNEEDEEEELKTRRGGRLCGVDEGSSEDARRGRHLSRTWSELRSLRALPEVSLSEIPGTRHTLGFKLGQYAGL